LQVFTNDAAETKRDNHLSSLEFSTLSLSDKLLQGITDAGFSHCTPIQEQTLPIALTGRDVAGQAQTGTGKTAAFLVALFHHLAVSDPIHSSQPGPRALILAPTRELAIQIHADAVQLGRHLSFKLGLAYGGTDYEKQKQSLQGVDVLIGTPGRVIDYLKNKVFSFRRVQVMILDEADRMFDLGFIKDIRFVLRRLPERDMRLNMLFSATLSHRVLELAYEHMNDPELIRIEPEKMTVDGVRQSIYFPSNKEKIPLLITLLRQQNPHRSMVFVNTRREADKLQNFLEHNGIHAQAISGDVPQNKRQRMLKEFLSGDLPVLIGTDVASRGLHIPDVSHVFNYDLPQDAEDYVHRIGRTARAGASGNAISFGCENYAMSLPDIEKYIGRKIPVEQIDREALMPIKIPPYRPRKTPLTQSRSSSGGPRRNR
jgi:ATP-dependent RNA helicase RhlB